jgi:crotonobetainyl-CoA:carnitine CoA-transferase CaiB-like acyl-CoA transferase
MQEPAQDKHALAPYRVLDLTQGGCLLCGKLLADLGADVIKIEAPGGDPTRGLGPFYKNQASPERSLYWFAYNTNKRGITLNIETEKGQEIFKRLVEKADFVLESFTPGYLDGLGLGYTRLSEINPHLVVTSITPFGQAGPYARFKGPDLITWALGGYLFVVGYPEKPVWISFPQASLHGGAEAAGATLAAHWYRVQSGEGQQVDVSIQESVTDLLWNVTEFWDMNKFVVNRVGNGWKTALATMRQVFPVKDGHVAILLMGGGGAGMVASDKALVQLMDEAGMAPEWLKTFDWVNEFDTMTMTQETFDRVAEPIANFLLTQTKERLFAEAIKRRILVAPANSVKDILDSPQLKARNFWVELEHPALGDTLKYTGAFVQMSETPIEIRRRAPLVGEHNKGIYLDELGMTESYLTTLRQSGVV